MDSLKEPLLSQCYLNYFLQCFSIKKYNEKNSFSPYDHFLNVRAHTEFSMSDPYSSPHSQGDFLMARKLCRQLSTSASPTTPQREGVAPPRLPFGQSNFGFAPPQRIPTEATYVPPISVTSSLGGHAPSYQSRNVSSTYLHGIDCISMDEMRRRLLDASHALEERDRQILLLQREVQQLHATVNQQREIFDTKIHGLKVDTLSHLIHSFKADGMREVDHWNVQGLGGRLSGMNSALS